MRRLGNSKKLAIRLLCTNELSRTCIHVIKLSVIKRYRNAYPLDYQFPQRKLRTQRGRLQ